MEYEIRTYEYLAGEILSARPSAGKTRIVSIDGPSGSGKTTFAVRLSRRLDCDTVHMDDLYPGWDGLAQAPSLLVEWILEPLAEGRPAGYRRYNWDRSEYAESYEVPPADVLVVEGVGSGALVAAPYIASLVWVEAPRDLRMERGIERDGEAFRPHWESWAGQEARMFASSKTRERADCVVSGSPGVMHDPEREFVCCFATSGGDE